MRGLLKARPCFEGVEWGRLWVPKHAKASQRLERLERLDRLERPRKARKVRKAEKG